MQCKRLYLPRSSHMLTSFAADIREFLLRYLYLLYSNSISGLQLLTQVIIADITTLKWRGLVSSLVSIWFIINAFVGANISTGVLEHSTWRWGCTYRIIRVPFSYSLLHFRRNVCYNAPLYLGPAYHYPVLGGTKGEEVRTRRESSEAFCLRLRRIRENTRPCHEAYMEHD